MKLEIWYDLDLPHYYSMYFRYFFLIFFEQLWSFLLNSWSSWNVILRKLLMNPRAKKNLKCWNSNQDNTNIYSNINIKNMKNIKFVTSNFDPTLFKISNNWNEHYREPYNTKINETRKKIKKSLKVGNYPEKITIRKSFHSSFNKKCIESSHQRSDSMKINHQPNITDK